GVTVDEAPDQPRTGDANDLGPRPRHPDRAAGLVAARQLVRAQEQLAVLAPGVIAAFQRLRVDALLAQPGGDALAELEAFLAGHDDGLAAVLRPPGCDLAEGAALRARDQARAGGEILVDAHVDDGRRVRQADQAGELRDGDFGGRRHWRP